MENTEPRKYQQVFEAMVENSPLAVYELVKDDFQDGWKKITRAPQHGNYNPNYLDVQVLCELILTNELTHLTVPVFPFAKRLGNPTFTGVDGWWQAYNVCVAWGLAIKWGFKRPQTTGVLRWLLETGKLDDLEQDTLHDAMQQYYAEHCPQMLAQETANI